MNVFNLFDIGSRWYLGITDDGNVLKAYIQKGENLKFAEWFPANQVEANLYKAWVKYIDSTYDYEYEYEYE